MHQILCQFETFLGNFETSSRRGQTNPPIGQAQWNPGLFDPGVSRVLLSFKYFAELIV